VEYLSKTKGSVYHSYLFWTKAQSEIDYSKIKEGLDLKLKKKNLPPAEREAELEKRLSDISAIHATKSEERRKNVEDATAAWEASEDKRMMEMLEALLAPFGALIEAMGHAGCLDGQRAEEGLRNEAIAIAVEKLGVPRSSLEVFTNLRWFQNCGDKYSSGEADVVLVEKNPPQAVVALLEIKMRPFDIVEAFRQASECEKRVYLELERNTMKAVDRSTCRAFAVTGFSSFRYSMGCEHVVKEVFMGMLHDDKVKRQQKYTFHDYQEAIEEELSGKKSPLTWLEDFGAECLIIVPQDTSDYMSNYDLALR